MSIGTPSWRFDADRRTASCMSRAHSGRRSSFQSLRTDTHQVRMSTRPSVLLALLIASATTSAAPSTGAAILEHIPISNACMSEARGLKPYFDAQDGGQSRQDALERLSTSTSPVRVVSIRSVELLYDFPALHRNAFGHYIAWSCHTRANGMTPRPLASLAEELQACFVKSQSERQSCVFSLRRKVFGLPADYRTPNDPVFILPPPVSPVRPPLVGKHGPS
jgi:hypothetical protein